MEKRIFKNLYFDIIKFFSITLFTLSSIIWLLQAVNYLDIISEDGHSIFTYFQYSFFNLPKIISKTFLLSYFLALFFVLTLYEENNQFLIFWSNGISKINLLNKLIKLSFIFIILSLFFYLLISPTSQNKARTIIKDSNLDFFPSLIKPKKFIDTVENLTVFINNKEGQSIEKIMLKDASNTNNIQIIIAERGKIFNEPLRKELRLFNGKIINTNLNNKTSIINFSETSFNLQNYHTKTTTSTKIQELSTQNIIQCVENISKRIKYDFEIFNCNKNILVDLLQELYKRFYLPFFTLLITIIVSYLTLKSNLDVNYKFYKILIFLVGIFLVVLSEISINFITESNILNLVSVLFFPIMFVILYVLFRHQIKFSH